MSLDLKRIVTRRSAPDLERLAPRRLGHITAPLPGALAMVGAYAGLRTLDAPELLIVGWGAVVVLVALASPLFGVTVLGALGPFTEALDDAGRMTVAPPLVAALGIGVAARTLLSGELRRQLRRPAIGLAVLLLVGTLLAVANAFWLRGAERGVLAFQLWVPGIGGALAALLAGAWVARLGDWRPLAVVAGSVTVAAVVSVVDHLTGGWLANGWLGWLLRPDVAAGRMGGVVPAPNPAAAIFLVGLAPVAALALLGTDLRWRIIAALASVPLVLAIALTFSRSGLLALTALALLLALRWRGWLATVPVILGALAVLVFAPESRILDPPPLADRLRVNAWRAAVEMWLARPLEGHGLRSFEWLHRPYGSPGLDAPHNEWLRFFAEGGVVVGVLGVAFAAVVLLTLVRAARWPAFAGGVAAATLFIMACFNNPFMYIQVNAPAFLVIGTSLGLAAVRSARSPPEEPSGS